MSDANDSNEDEATQSEGEEGNEEDENGGVGKESRGSSQVSLSCVWDQCGTRC
jgi:hypothetical protein